MKTLKPFSVSLPRRAFVLIALCAALVFSAAVGVNSDGQTIEEGKFRIYETKHVQGEETYKITREGDDLVLTSTLNLSSLDVEGPLAASLTVRRDLTPRQLNLKGTKASGDKVDLSVVVEGSSATVREGEQTRKVAVPARFFTLSGYAPASLQMMLIRYLVSQGVKNPVDILPAGKAAIEHRGRDEVELGGKKVLLDRYLLSGLSWGAQTVWMDSARRLVAVVNFGGGDVEATLAAIRDGYETALPFFLARTAEDRVARMTEAANSLARPLPRALVLSGGTLIDGTGSAPVADSVVVIEKDRIVAAGPRSRVSIPKGATVVDARGKYILPGLWDMHSHSFQAEFGPAYLAAGVTTVRDMGSEFEFVTVMRDAIKQGRGLGPDMLLAGYIEAKGDGPQVDFEVATPDEARAAVRRYKNAGFEQIKIRDRITLELLKAIAAEAHSLGMTLTGHVPRSLNARKAVEAGQDQISHINFVAPVINRGPEANKDIQFFIDHKTVIDPTLAYMEMFTRSKRKPITDFEPGFAHAPREYAEHVNNIGVPTESEVFYRNTFERFVAIVGALHKAGVPIVAGTDVVIPGHSLHRELELFVKAGLTPMEAIQAATVVPARVMKKEKDVGTVEAGKRADIIVIDSNPLESISNIRRLKWVIARGRMFDSEKLWRAAGFQP
ncbi:MAG TPA: amidohydrolase family protein [Blastocatellia bacterium]|nr:amidohydrolase family protein [Blastocatellia bacterium]